MTLEMAQKLALANLEAKCFTLAPATRADYEEAIRILAESFKPAPQAQDDVNSQLRRLVPIANNAGLYDAADHITQHLEICAKRTERREKLRQAGQSPKED